MKRIQFIVLLLILLMLNGCGAGADIPFSGSNAPPSAAVEEDSDKLSAAAEAAFQEVRENTKEDDSKAPETGADERTVTAENKQPDDGKTDAAGISSQPVTNQKDPAPKGSHKDEEFQETHDAEQEPVTESESEEEPEQEQPVDPPPKASEDESDPASEPESEKESKSEPETDPEPAFDIGSWISYARNTATGLGLELDSSAVDCWDNPITANPDCIYLERDITARLSRYARDEDITAVWIWYETVGTNMYLIYIGYA